MIDIRPLQQGLFTVANKQFAKVTEDETKQHSYMIAVQAFLLRLNGQYVLFDTGLSLSSFQLNKPDIIYLLEQEGISPQDISKIYLSHFHLDHFSGLFHPKTQNLLFPHATIYAFEKSLKQVIEMNRYPHYTQKLIQLQAHPKLKLLKEDSGTINNYVRYICSGGHSQFHIVFWAEENGEIVFFGGDEAPQLRQMKLRFMAKYDFDKQKANKLRQQWFKEGTKQGWTFLFFHDKETPIFRAD